MSDTEHEFDTEWYAKCADKMIDLSWDEYKQVTFERHRVQHAILRNYLWLATVVFSAECVGFSQVFDGVVWFGLSLHGNLVFNIFAGSSVAISFLAIALGIDSMRGKLPGVDQPFREWNALYFAGTAWKEANGEAGKTTMHLDLLEHLDKSINHNKELAMRKGKRLRCMSYMLLASFGTGLCAMMSAIIF